jgi:hypothetical protein
MDSIKALLGSEHGLFAILLVIASSVFVGIGKMNIDQWTSFAEWVFGIFGGTHAAAALSSAIKPAGIATSPGLDKTPMKED